MKTVKIYWRLAIVLSLLTTLLWGVVYWGTGSIPEPGFYLPIVNWAYNLFPPLLLSRWWDILGVFLSVISYSVFEYVYGKPEEIKTALMGIFSIIAFVVFICGAILAVLITLSANMLLGLVPVLIGTILACALEYVASLIPIDFQKKCWAWLMQRE